MDFSRDLYARHVHLHAVFTDVVLYFECGKLRRFQQEKADACTSRYFRGVVSRRLLDRRYSVEQSECVQ
jgi:hypothetical protein